MREIKFRYWTGDRMIQVRRLTFNDDEFIVEGEGVVHYANAGSLLQFTGLHDKNGLEIYESDIVRVSADGKSYVSVVIGPDSEYPAFDLDSKYIPDQWYYDANVLSTIATGEFEEMEVIGNVHQNPELLKAGLS